MKDGRKAWQNVKMALTTSVCDEHFQAVSVHGQSVMLYMIIVAMLQMHCYGHLVLVQVNYITQCQSLQDVPVYTVHSHSSSTV